MKQRTTISLNQNYLDSLKIIAVKRDTTMSSLINEAVRKYLSQLRKSKSNTTFFNEVDRLKDSASLKEDELNKYVKKGRI